MTFSEEKVLPINMKVGYKYGWYKEYSNFHFVITKRTLYGVYVEYLSGASGLIYFEDENLAAYEVVYSSLEKGLM